MKSEKLPSDTGLPRVCVSSGQSGLDFLDKLLHNLTQNIFDSVGRSLVVVGGFARA